MIINTLKHSNTQTLKHSNTPMFRTRSSNTGKKLPLRDIVRVTVDEVSQAAKISQAAGAGVPTEAETQALIDKTVVRAVAYLRDAGHTITRDEEK